MKTKFFLLVSILTASIISSAQFGGGAFVGYNGHLNSTQGISNIGIGVFGDYQLKSNNGVRVGLHYGFPSTESKTFSANANSSTIDPGYIDVTGDVNSTAFYAFGDFKLYFKDGSYDDGGFYGNLGLGLGFIGLQTDYEYPNPNPGYTVTNRSDEAEKKNFNQLFVNLGAGYEISIASMKLFIETGFGIPPTQSENGATLEVEVPGYVKLRGGLRF